MTFVTFTQKKDSTVRQDQGLRGLIREIIHRFAELFLD